MLAHRAAMSAAADTAMPVFPWWNVFVFKITMDDLR
jgi:hypothetical protein